MRSRSPSARLRRIAHFLGVEVAERYLSLECWSICGAIDECDRQGVMTREDRMDCYGWLADLGMRGAFPYDDLMPGMYRVLSMTEDKVAVRYAWLKFAAKLAREEARELQAAQTPRAQTQD